MYGETGSARHGYDDNEDKHKYCSHIIVVLINISISSNDNRFIRNKPQPDYHCHYNSRSPQPIYDLRLNFAKY